MNSSLKHRTAHSLKWNVIDRLLSQGLYAVTGIVLARELSQEAFGLVGAILVFQAFASLFVDSGFSYALIQRKQPSPLDYSSVFWFNMLMATTLYVVLWFCAPLIADCFGADERLIGLSRVMFLSFIFNALGIVQTNRLMKRMNVRPIAATNAAALFAGGVVGIWLAVDGYGAWALVWQTITVAVVKTTLLWIWCRWLPMMRMSLKSLRSFMSVGMGMMLTSFLNTLFLNIYAFVIGNRSGLVNLGYYSQADKWSKMGITSVTQVVTSSFLPSLAEVQDDDERFRRIASKMNRFTAYLLFPAIGFLILMATPLFHVLFGAKWDASIILFQLLLVRGVFTVFNALYNNYILSLGHARAIFGLEIFRDVVALGGIFIALPFINLSTPDNIVYGLTLLLWGQVAASFLTWIATLIVTIRLTHCSLRRFILDLAPYFCLTLLIMACALPIMGLSMPDWLMLGILVIACPTVYLGINALLRSKIQSEIFRMIFKRKIE